MQNANGGCKEGWFARFAFCILHFEFQDRFVLEHRRAKNRVDPFRPYATVWEEEPDEYGSLVPTAVVFLTNRECPFRCVMCDLWTNTMDEVVPRGAVPQQIRTALAELPPARHIKLYNAGSFFDSQQIPSEDDEEIAEMVAGFERVIVEAHPAFLAGVYADRCRRFQSLLAGRLEVAIGLETAHPDVLARLNKRMTLDAFRRAADFLHRHEIALRVFVLLSPPFMPADEAVEWACRSIDLAAECGATVCSIIPTRGGNGAMEAIGDAFTPPRLPALEQVVEYGLSAFACGETRRSRDGELRLGPAMRVFADVWDVQRFFSCACSPARAARLTTMSRTQRVAAPVHCHSCQN
jgi:radical SAM enzyme (TIGR01210 family)